MSIRLTYRGYDVAMPNGEFVVGRGADCQLCLNDAIVSRRHAIIHVTSGFVVIEDLGSRNGVLVNGERVDGKRALADGDRIVMGGQELTFHASGGPTPRITRAMPVTDPAAAAYRVSEPKRPGSTTVGLSLGDSEDPLESFDQVWKVSLAALSSGRTSEAERILERPLAEVLSRHRCGIDVSTDLCEAAARAAAELGGATKNGYWVDYVFDLYTLRAATLPDDTILALGRLAGLVAPVDKQTIRLYVAGQRKNALSTASVARLEDSARRFGVA